LQKSKNEGSVCDVAGALRDTDQQSDLGCSSQTDLLIPRTSAAVAAAVVVAAAIIAAIAIVVAAVVISFVIA
jgi:hypothetical protein